MINGDYYMNYILITKDNIDKEHICCAMSNKQADMKKMWLKARFDEGLVFYRRVDRGKCFIEYIDAEKAWNPIDATNYTFINCMWIAGSMKGHGYSNDLLDYCINDSKKKGKIGICIISSKKKKGFISDSKFLEYKGFKIADETPTGFTLMYLPFFEDGLVPKFKENAKRSRIDEKGIVIYYTYQCPFTYYWVPREVEALKEYGIEVKAILIDNVLEAQKMPVPVTNYGLFIDGQYITHEIQSEKKILSLVGIKDK